MCFDFLHHQPLVQNEEIHVEYMKQSSLEYLTEKRSWGRHWSRRYLIMCPAISHMNMAIGKTIVIIKVVVDPIYMNDA